MKTFSMYKQKSEPHCLLSCSGRAYLCTFDPANQKKYPDRWAGASSKLGLLL